MRRDSALPGKHFTRIEVQRLHSNELPRWHRRWPVFESSIVWWSDGPATNQATGSTRVPRRIRSLPNTGVNRQTQRGASIAPALHSGFVYRPPLRKLTGVHGVTVRVTSANREV